MKIRSSTYISVIHKMQKYVWVFPFLIFTLQILNKKCKTEEIINTQFLPKSCFYFLYWTHTLLLTSCSATWNIFLSENKLCSVWSIQSNLRHPAAHNCTDVLQQIFTLHAGAWHLNKCKLFHGILDTNWFKQALLRDHCAKTSGLIAPSVEISHFSECT